MSDPKVNIHFAAGPKLVLDNRHTIQTDIMDELYLVSSSRDCSLLQKHLYTLTNECTQDGRA